MEKFSHKKSLGQHFLNSSYAPRKLCEAAGDLVGKTVLEIGPGTGVLTQELLERGAMVVAVEADQRALAVLRDKFQTAIALGQLTLFHHDARVLNPADFGLKNHQYACVSNIPYYLSGSLFRSLLDTNCQPHTIVFLVQKEVAERIARDKKESILSLSVKVFGTPTYICTVKRGHFTPPPKVDSAILAIKNIHNPLSEELSGLFFNLLRLGFGQKRKQLAGNLSSTYDPEVVAAALRAAATPHTARAEDIPLAKWLIMADELQGQQQPK